jgi:hypothetical protein
LSIAVPTKADLLAAVAADIEAYFPEHAATLRSFARVGGKAERDADGPSLYELNLSCRAPFRCARGFLVRTVAIEKMIR